MEPVRKGIYRHFKGKKYRVLGTARHSETLKEFVVYQALYASKKFGKNALWIRPLKLFLQKTRFNHKTVPRFRFIRK